jgi:hypothetical protein
VAVDLFVDPPTIDLPSLQSLRNERWANCPTVVRRVVAQEYQYFLFQCMLLERLRFTAPGMLDSKPWRKPLDLAVRAGAVKAALLVAASIIEAVLRAVAEHRAYPLPLNARHRTLGKVLGSWQQVENGPPREEVQAIWPTLQRLYEVRNNVHLFAIEGSSHAHFWAVLRQEEELLAGAQEAVHHVARIVP